jgi:hypothetical protein
MHFLFCLCFAGHLSLMHRLCTASPWPVLPRLQLQRQLTLRLICSRAIMVLTQVLPLLERCHIYALDLRAHGISTAPADDGWLKSSWTCLATDVLAVLEALSLQGFNTLSQGCNCGGQVKVKYTMKSSWINGLPPTRGLQSHQTFVFHAFVAHCYPFSPLKRL